MPNRLVSVAVLLFSFAVTLFGFKAKADTPIISYNREFHVPVVTLPVQAYWVVGAIASLGALFCIVAASKQKWREPVEAFVTKNRYAYYPGFVVFWGVFTVAFLKGVGAVISVSPQAWVVLLAFYFGFLLFIVIPIISFKERPRQKNNVSRTRGVNQLIQK